jgi:hypothetical protein
MRSGAMKKRDKEAYDRITRQMLDVSQQPFPQKLQAAKTVTDELDRISNTSKPERYSYIITLLLLPPQETVFEVHAKALALRNATIAGIAIERFRRDHGQIPNELSELVPNYLDAVPSDPFDGQPLRYLQRDDRFAVYSLGRNGEDDGGNASGEADIVFEVRQTRTSAPQPLVSAHAPASAGSGGMSEDQRKSIYFRARIVIQSTERFLESFARNYDDMTRHQSDEARRRIQEIHDNVRRQRLESQERNLESLCSEHGISRDDLQEILREGEAAGWPPSGRR